MFKLQGSWHCIPCVFHLANSRFFKFTILQITRNRRQSNFTFVTTCSMQVPTVLFSIEEEEEEKIVRCDNFVCTDNLVCCDNTFYNFCLLQFILLNPTILKALKISIAPIILIASIILIALIGAFCVFFCVTNIHHLGHHFWLFSQT